LYSEGKGINSNLLPLEIGEKNAACGKSYLQTDLRGDQRREEKTRGRGSGLGLTEGLYQPLRRHVAEQEYSKAAGQVGKVSERGKVSAPNAAVASRSSQGRNLLKKAARCW